MMLGLFLVAGLFLAVSGLFRRAGGVVEVSVQPLFDQKKMDKRRLPRFSLDAYKQQAFP